MAPNALVDSFCHNQEKCGTQRVNTLPANDVYKCASGMQGTTIAVPQISKSVDKPAKGGSMEPEGSSMKIWGHNPHSEV